MEDERDWYRLVTSSEFMALQERELDLLEAMRGGNVETAKEWARHSLRQDLEAGWLVADGGHRWRAGELRSSASDVKLVKNSTGGFVAQRSWNENKLSALVASADNGDEDAHQAVCDIIVEHLQTNKSAPPILQQFLIELLRGARVKPAPARGWDHVGTYSRDLCISMMVSHLMYHGGFGRTRNAATRDKGGKPSACSIVAEALMEVGVMLSEKTVAQITSPKNKRLRKAAS